MTAIAFVLATALPGTAAARVMPMEKACGDCPRKAPANGDLGKMPCGALACAGVAIGLPARLAAYLPELTMLSYTPPSVAETVGSAPMPDPFPPRPSVLD